MQHRNPRMHAQSDSQAELVRIVAEQRARRVRMDVQPSTEIYCLLDSYHGKAPLYNL